MKKLLIGAAVVVAVGAGGASWWLQASPAAVVKNRVLAALNDPSSAEFKVVEYNSRHKTGCGFVNARNRMGGMVGFTAFIAYPDGEVRFEPSFNDPGHSGWHDQAVVYCEADSGDSPFWRELANAPS